MCVEAAQEGSMGEGESERWGLGCGDSWRREEVDEGKKRTEGDRARLELVGVGWAYGPTRVARLGGGPRGQ